MRTSHSCSFSLLPSRSCWQQGKEHTSESALKASLTAPFLSAESRLGTKAVLNEFDPECHSHQCTKADLSEFDANSEAHMTRRHSALSL